MRSLSTVEKKPITNTSFGKGFVAPKISKSLSSTSKPVPQKKVSDEEKIKALLANNPIKKLLEQEEKKNALPPALFKKGDRVFHPQFGIGAVNDVQANGQTYTYVVEFSKHGEKSLDSEYCDLKRF